MEGSRQNQLFSLLFIVLIAVVFTLQFGPGSQGCGTQLQEDAVASAAEVNGKPITVRAFNTAFDNVLNNMRAQGSPIPESLARQIGYPKQVLEMLVQQELVEQAAEARGITASDEELREAIRKNPSFQKEGAFSSQLYKEVVRDYIGQTVPEFERNLRRQIGAQKLEALIANAAVVSEDEVKAKFFREGNTAEVTFVRFLPSMFAGGTEKATPEQVAQFQGANAPAIADYYQKNQYLYFQPEKVRARHILLKVAPDAPEAKVAETKEKIGNLKKELDSGKDFAELAKQFSEDVGSRESGGDLGLNDRQNWVPEFGTAAFALKPGEVSAPVKTQFGFHLIKVEEKKPPETRTLEQATPEIAAQLLQKEGAKLKARAEAEKALAAVKAGKTLAELYPAAAEPADDEKMRFETETKPESQSTGPFSSASGVFPKLGPAPELFTSVFAANGPQLLDRVYPAGEGFVVAQVTGRKQASENEYTTASEKLRDEARQAKRIELRQSFVNALRKGGQVTLNEAALTSEAG